MSRQKRIYLIIIAILFIEFYSHKSYAKDPSELVFGFCYALQASMFCNDLKMRMDTEGKIEKQVGTIIRGPKSPYNKDCLAGLNRAFEDKDNGLCKIAWEKYGCDGSDFPL